MAFTAVAAITVTRAALTALANVLCGGASFRGGCALTFCQCQIGRGGIAGCSVVLPAFTSLTPLATFTAAFATPFTTPFTTFPATFAARRALTAHVSAVCAQLGLGL